MVKFVVRMSEPTAVMYALTARFSSRMKFDLPAPERAARKMVTLNISSQPPIGYCSRACPRAKR